MFSTERLPERTCPHADIADCPLYRAAHCGQGFGCDDGEMQLGCAVTKGKMNYDAEVERGTKARWCRRLN